MWEEWSQSRAFAYVMAALFFVVWWAASGVRSFLRRGQPPEPRPRRRLPLD